MNKVVMIVASCALVIGSYADSSAQNAPEQRSAMERMLEPGPEAKQLAERSGEWDVIFTIWPAPGAKPRVTRGLIAERKMIGPFLQETLRPASPGPVADFRRIDYLGFERTEGRWQYVSLDTRYPVGIMPAWSFGAQQADTIALTFEALAFPGFGTEVEGKLTRSDMKVVWQGPDHELKQQHFIQADGTGRSWLAVQYEYTRRH